MSNSAHISLCMQQYKNWYCSELLFVLTGIWGRGTRPLALALSCISLRCCFQYLYGGIPSLHKHRGKKKMNKNQLQICNIFTKLKSVVLSEAQQAVCEYLHTAVGQWHCVCIARHALLLTVIGTGCWSPRITHVCVVWVYRLSPWPEEELRHRDSCEGAMLNFQGFLQNIRTSFFFFALVMSDMMLVNCAKKNVLKASKLWIQKCEASRLNTQNGKKGSESLAAH